MAEIKITIDGSDFPPKITAEVEGMQGHGCANWLDEVMRATGMQTKSQRLKPEFAKVTTGMQQKRRA